MKEKKVVKIFIFFFAILFAFFSANLYLKKFENNYFTIDHYKYPSIYQEDTISYYFSLSDKIDEDIKIGKKYFESGDVYVNSFLYPRIINLFNSLTNNKKKIFNENTNVIKLENDKIFIYLQILFFFCSVAYLYFTLTQSKLLNKEVIKIFCLITLINPIIFQWHLSFLTESIFLSFLILFISFFIKSKNIYHYLFIGIFIGVMYAQRTINYFIPLILIYIFFLNEKLIYKLTKFFALLFGLILVITLIGLQTAKELKYFISHQHNQS